MKISAQNRKLRRRLLDQRIARVFPTRDTAQQKDGWVRAVREVIGMTAQQLAKRLNVSTATVLAFEQREQRGKVTLELLDRAAKAMKCQLVYAILPQKSFEDLVEEQARRIAQKMLERISHSMALEAQFTDDIELNAQLEELTTKIKNEMKTVLWATQ
jgi:predicted DNA-binding mobile mystery protein A